MVQSLLPTQVIYATALLAWLGICVVYDLRSRQVPTPLTVIPLVLAAAWRFTLGGWMMVLLTIVLILISDIPSTRWRIPLGTVATGLGLAFSQSMPMTFALLAIFAVWVMWERGATGGADAKMILTLVLLFGDGFLLVPIALAGGFQGIAALIARRKTIPYTVSIALGTAAWLWLSARG